MLRKRSFDKSIKEAIALGEENRRLISRLEPWCGRLKVMLRSHSLLGQETGLPIGLLSIECPHSKESSMQGGNFKSIASYFVQSNCRECPHQQELNSKNLGREILHAVEQIREEESKPKPASSARERLRSLVSADLTKALKSAPTTEQSVLECVARLENEKDAAQAAEILVKAAEVAPDLFSPIAVTVIAEFLGDLRCARDCARTLRVLGSRTHGLSPAAVDTAIKQLNGSICDDEVLELLADHFSTAEKLPNLGIVSRIFELHGWHSHGGGIISDPVANHGQVRLLATIARRDIRLVADAANRLLSSMEDGHHSAVAVTLHDLVPECPAIGLEMLNGLLGALRQGHDDHGNVDADLCEAIAQVYMFYPSETQAWLTREIPKIDAETQSAVFRTYDRLWRAAEYGDKSKPRAARARAVLPNVVSALVPALTQPSIGLEARGEAAETLAYIADDFPKLLQDRLDGLFGALALVVQEHFAFSKANPGGDPQLPGFPRGEHSKYDRIVNRVVKALEKMAHFAPAETLRDAEQLFDGLKSNDDSHAAAKRHLLQVAEALTHDDVTALALVRWIYRAMMDPDSVLVRMEAINVIGEMLRRSNDLVPENMREMLIIYVGDRYVAVAYAATKAARRLQPDDLTEAKRILSGMLTLYAHYISQSGHQYERAEVCESVVVLCRKYPVLFPYALGILVKEASGSDKHGASEALREWERLLSVFPNSRELFVRELLAYLSRHPLTPDDVHNNSGEYHCVLALYEATKAEIVANLEGFSPAISAAAKIHPFVPLQLIAILLHHEQFAAAAMAAASMAQSIPEGRFQQLLRDELLLIQAAAQAEVQVTAGNPAEALRLLAAEQSRLQRYEKKEEPHQSDALVQAFSLASRVADRIN